MVFFPYIHGIQFHGILLTLVLNGSLKQFRMFGQLLASKKNSWCLKNHLTRFHCLFRWNMDFLFRICFWNPFLDSCFHVFFMFTTFPCEMIQFDLRIIFSNGLGLFNHQQTRFVFWLEPKVTKRHLTLHRRHFWLVEFIHLGVGVLAIEVRITTKDDQLDWGEPWEFW